jgi:hypothetical protein
MAGLEAWLSLETPGSALLHRTRPGKKIEENPIGQTFGR